VLHGRRGASRTGDAEERTTDGHGLGKGLSINAVLTGICRSGGSADTLVREFIRVSGCPAIHVRIADSAACVRGESSSATLASWRLSPIPLCIVCIFVANLLLLLWRSWRLGGSYKSQSPSDFYNPHSSAPIYGYSPPLSAFIRVHPWFFPLN
jgi:hypothetical protein